jgi:hypothetical protein
VALARKTMAAFIVSSASRRHDEIGEDAAATRRAD